MCAQKKFVMYRNVGVQRKVVLIEGNGCIVFCEYKKKKKRKKQKGKRKKDLEGRHVMVRKHKSFVESKHIFWKQGTDAKSLFS